ncbi:MAG: hypothetical protein CML06_09890 [Pseudomonadales bacterium]|nr:hypothetical protein [Pseudomonadales bacterium]
MPTNKKCGAPTLPPWRPPLPLGLLLALWLLLLGPLTAVAETAATVKLHPDLLRDTSGRLQLQDLMQGHNEVRWHSAEPGVINLGFTGDVLWLRTPLPAAATDGEHLLEVGYPMLDDLRVYLVSDAGVLQRWQLGDQRPFSTRPLWHRNFLVPLPATTKPVTLLLRVRSEGALEVPLQVWQRDAYWQREQGALLVQGAFAGILLVMILYNLVIYTLVRDQSYLFYIGYGIAILLFELAVNGLAYQYLWPRLAAWHQLSLPLFICFAAVFRCMFTIHFLDLTARWPLAAWVLGAVIALALLLASLSLVVPYNLAITLATLLVLPSTAVCLVVGALLWWRGVRQARYFVIGWALYLIGAFTYAAAKLGWLEVNLVTENLLQVGITLELVLFSIALADRINVARWDRISAQKQSIHHLERYRSLYENATEGIYHSDLKGQLLAVNPAMAEILGFTSPEEMLAAYRQRPVTVFMEATDFHDLARAIMEYGEVKQFEARGWRKDGQACWLSISAKVISGTHWGVDTVIEGFVFDTTQRKRNEEQLVFLSRHDPLTGLVNRREFENRLHQALEEVQYQQESHTLLLLDLDQFKLVNETCGHVAGDELLRQITLGLRQLTRGGDVLARLGGDEFAILLTNCSDSNAVRVAEKIRSHIQGMRFEWDHRQFHLAASVGLVHLQQAPDSVRDAMNLADAACHRAKASGRNRVQVYDPADVQFASHQSQSDWATRVSAALEQDGFILYVQPITAVNGDVHRRRSYEVLLRMRDNEELAFPGTFLPAAERYNLMPLLDRWVVSRVMQWLAANPAKQLAIGDMAINLSGQTLADHRFPAFLREQFERHRIDPHQICFEITETIAVTNLTNTLKFIEEFRGLGCSFALDDFGSGFSSYGYLKNLPVDYLKIDGAFVRDLVDSKVDRAMVESINRIGHVMGKRTIAEFVENQQILECLQRIGVDYAQGYGIARPFPIDRIQALQSAG